MPISVECQGCGRKFQAPEKLAGKRAKCPNCSAVIQLGARPPEPSEQVVTGQDSAQPIPVACCCGKRFQAQAELAGKRVKCPACGQALAIPCPAAGTAPTESLDLNQLTAAETATKTLPRAHLGSSKRRTNGSNTPLIVGLSVGAGAVVLVLVMLLWLSGDNAELAEEGTIPGTLPSESVEAPRSLSPPPPGDADDPTVPSGQLASAATAAARTYPSFPDAVTEVPAWNDAKPPFDLAGFLKAPPAEENAAPLYLDALFEFGELSFCYVPTGLKSSQYPDEVKRRIELASKREKEYFRIDEAWEKDPDSVDMAAVDTWLSEYDVGFQKLAAAQQRPRCAFQTGLGIVSLLAHAHSARSVARVALWRTRRDIEQAEYERPIQDLKIVLRLSRDLRPRGDMVSQLTSIAVDGICCRQIVPLILTAPGTETQHCDRLLTLLVEHESETVDPLITGIQADYFMVRFTLHDLQHRTGTFDPRHMKDGIGFEGNVDSWLACIQMIDAFEGIGEIGKERQKALTNRVTEGHALLPSAWTGGKVLSDDDYAKHVEAVNRVFASFLDLAGQPDLHRQDFDRDTITRICEPLWETTLGVFMPVSAIRTARNVCLREQATLRGTQCLIALRRWQLEHAELPDELDKVVEAAGMSGVPLDPYSDQPLRMGSVAGKPAIYSVGDDGRDDKAQVDWNLAPNQPGDFIFRLEAPQ